MQSERADIQVVEIISVRRAKFLSLV